MKLIISFADACQCGDGTIYRAAGFKLHSFKKNNSLLIDAAGNVDFNHGNKKKPVAKKALDNGIMPDGSYGSYGSSQLLPNGEKRFKPIEGFQMKYLFFFDKELEKKFKFVSFADIPKEVRMYKGERASSKENVASGFQSGEGGANPTDALQLGAVS